MPEVIIKYKSKRALKALTDLAKVFDMNIEKSVKNIIPENTGQPKQKLSITFAKNPHLKALAGIWEGREVDLDELRKEAWGTEFEFCNLRY